MQRDSGLSQFTEIRAAVGLVGVDISPGEVFVHQIYVLLVLEKRPVNGTFHRLDHRISTPKALVKEIDVFPLCFLQCGKGLITLQTGNQLEGENVPQVIAALPLGEDVLA